MLAQAPTRVKHTPTEEQQAVIDAAGGGASLMVKAYAGAAKSTTLEMAAPRVRVPALALAFNVSVAKALAARMPPNFTCKTMNGLGASAFMAARPGVTFGKPDEKKLGKLLSQLARDNKVQLSSEAWDWSRRLVTAAQLKGISPGDRGDPLEPDTPEVWTELADDLWVPRDEQGFICDFARSVLLESNILAERGQMSFDDQVYGSVVLGGKWPKFPVAFVDEAQDLNPLNHAMVGLATRTDAKLVVVGDPLQCHPVGTVVELTGGGGANIEDLEVGQELVSFNRKAGFTGTRVQGRKVLNKRIFHFDGELVHISTEDGHQQECTPNHRCLVKWEDKAGYSVYLMQLGDRFRIGTAKNWYSTEQSTGGFGPNMRMRQEGADAVWVLKSFHSKDEAMIEEKVIWTLFGLPDLIFRCSGKASSTQKHLDLAWDAIGDNKMRALRCLKHFKREYDFPMHRRGDGKHIGEKKFITQACNIIDGVMEVLVFESERENWQTAYVSHVPYKGPVVGITVETNGFGQNLYIANGIVTHNSIYGFRGSHSDSMGQLALLRPTWQDLGLRTTFRCPRTIVERQRHHAPGFQAAPGNAEGLVERAPLLAPENFSDPGASEETGWNWDWILAQAVPSEAERPSRAVLCRNNAPLLALAFKLIRSGVGPVMAGRDIGKGLLALSKKLAPQDGMTRDLVAGAITEWLAAETSLALANGQDEKVAGLTDRAESLRAVLDGAQARDAGELRSALARIFAREEGDIVLSTIHRAKGLEYDLVLHLDPWRIPSKRAREAAQLGDRSALQQELNLRYVCETRTRHTLLLASLDDWRA